MRNDSPRFVCPTCGSDDIAVEYSETARYIVVRWDEHGSLEEYDPNSRTEEDADFNTFVCDNGCTFDEPVRAGGDDAAG